MERTISVVGWLFLVVGLASLGGGAYTFSQAADRGLGFFLGCFGVVFGAIGGGILAARVVRKRREAELRLNGRRVQARFQSVERNTGLEVNGNYPWRIVCQWQDPRTGLLHVFKSANLWFDPTPYVRVQELTVFVDPQNPRRYAVDVDFLPRLAT